MKSTYKFILVFLLSLAYQSAKADLEVSLHQTLLKKMLAAVAPTNFEEARTYYFGTSNGQVIEIYNGKNIGFRIQDTNDKDLGFDLDSNDKSTVSIVSDKDGKTSLNVTNYFFENAGNKEVFSTNQIVLNNFSQKETTKKPSLEILSIQKSFWKYDTSSGKAETYHWVKTSKPEVRQIKASASFILSLGEGQISDMGLLATKKTSDERDPEGGTCTMKSSYIMECEWNLETDYTPDTLHGAYSIKEGQISELLDAWIEPGC